MLFLEGDSIHVPNYDPTVVVAGAVNFESRVLYVPGKGLDYYIRQAGGFADNADRKGVVVAYPNGERSAISGGLMFRDTPDVQPGSQIIVPVRPERQGTNWDQIFTRSTAILTAAATALLAISQLR